MKRKQLILIRRVLYVCIALVIALQVIRLEYDHSALYLISFFYLVSIIVGYIEQEIENEQKKYEISNKHYVLSGIAVLVALILLLLFLISGAFS